MSTDPSDKDFENPQSDPNLDPPDEDNGSDEGDDEDEGEDDDEEDKLEISDNLQLKGGFMMAKQKNETKEKPPLVTTEKRPSVSLGKDEKPTEQEIEKDVLSIAAWRKRSLHGAESPYLEKLKKYKGMTSNKELGETIEKLIKEMEGEVSGDEPGKKHTHSEKTRQSPL